MSPEEAVTNAGRDTYSLELALIVGLGVVSMKELPYKRLNNALLRVYQLVFPIYFRVVNEMYLLDSTDWVKAKLSLETSGSRPQNECSWVSLALSDSPIVLCRCRLSVTIHSVLGRIRFELFFEFHISAAQKIACQDCAFVADSHFVSFRARLKYTCAMAEKRGADSGALIVSKKLKTDEPSSTALITVWI